MSAASMRAVIWLSWFTILYNVAEGVVSVMFGFDEGSVSLFGFGIDSFIETLSATVVLWRFKKEISLKGDDQLEREKFATRMIGFLLLVLAGLTAAFSTIQLVNRSHPATTLPGVIISLLSLSFMFFLWSRKRKLGVELGSQVILSDAKCSMACIQLSFVLLLGSALFYLVPELWWIDSVAALIMSAYIFKEGLEIRGNSASGATCCGF